MAQSGFTPIQLYFTTTAAAAPSAGNLANGELAINITDGRLFYKDNGGTVRVLAGTSGSGVVAGSNTQVQFNNNGVFGASANMVFNGTRLTVADFADSGLTAGRVTYASTGGALVDSANLTFNGTTLTTNALTVSSAVTLTAGMANGVAYLNGSKVLTTGSALTFNGTNFATTGTSSGSRIITTSTLADGSTPHLDTSASTYGIVGGSSSMGYKATSQHIWNLSGTSEQMRLTFIGLGIGTSSPLFKVDARGSSGTGISFIETSSGNSNRVQLGTGAGFGFINADAGAGTIALALQVSGSTKATLDSSGNLGLGVTPSAWASGLTSFDLKSESFISGGGNYLSILSNVYFNSGARYKTTGFAATEYLSQGGAHVWRTAPSGTAGNAISFTQAMTLDASGRLGVGTTSPDSRFVLNSASGECAQQFQLAGTARAYVGVAAGSGQLISTSAANDFCIRSGSNLLFSTGGDTERARIDSSGNLLVGTTSTTVNPGIVVYGGIANAQIQIGHGNNVSSGEGYMGFQYNGSLIGSITQNGTTSVLYNITSDQRLKENIQDAASASALIDSLQVREYDWKADGLHQRYGFIAQELVTVAPEAVHQPADPEAMMAVDYSKLVPMLVKEIQSLRKRLAAAGIA